MVLFLLLVIAAIALGIVGVVVKGLFWLLIIGIVVIVVDLIVVGVRLSRRRRPNR
jgi:membrane protein implicated in regulation of membrane protease activity